MLVEFVSNFNQESSMSHRFQMKSGVFQMRILQFWGNLSSLSVSSFPPASNNHGVGAEFYLFLFESDYTFQTLTDPEISVARVDLADRGISLVSLSIT